MYKRALKINKKLAVNANKFEKNKILLLYTIVEKDDGRITKDKDGNEDAVVIGSKDDDARKRIMTTCR